ncbi:hypothetical protein F7018_17175 [Tenacibaculum aiptasiae]|uniref:Uncharacterized protein n=1 Tax=Tenacibaculum aiptasiae TaxID=426481 RepID=A0A7J5A769_9FLAO|nr:hypothetical protein [Tenacibaculum aiptasiae]KAB1153396.1 hypothetical protein F7018_17175 [Tenacibaculum aiptasiae]
MKIYKLFLLLFFLISCKNKVDDTIFLEIKSPQNCIHQIYVINKTNVKIDVGIDLSVNDTIYKKETLKIIETIRFNINKKDGDSINSLAQKIKNSNLTKGSYSWDAFKYSLKINGVLIKEIYNHDNNLYEIIGIINENLDSELDYFCHKY